MQLDMETSKQLTLDFGLEKSISLPEDSHAKMQAAPILTMAGDKLDWRGKELGFIGTCSGQLRKFDPDSLLLKMSPTSLLPTEVQTLPKSSSPFMKSGTMQNGVVCTHRILGPSTKGSGAISLLTPCATDYKRANLSSPLWKKRMHRSPGTLPEQLSRMGFTGMLNPLFPIWIMGFPTNWTGPGIGMTRRSKGLATP